MSQVALDHLVVAAHTLEQGVAWCESTLGITPGPGGRHAVFGTHNRLFLLGAADDARWPLAYFEIIAIDPQAAPPQRPRWFGLDDPARRAAIAEQPRLVAWVARSTMLDMHRWGLITIGLKPGDPVAASRETAQGLLAWQILVRADGGSECGGALPTLIQWQGRHPAEHMPASGVRLRTLTLRGLPERARQVLRLRGIASEAAETGSRENGATGATGSISAVLDTPRGEVLLEGPPAATPSTTPAT